MTIDEVFARIVRGHLLLLLVCMLIPVGIMVYSTSGTIPQWNASVRIQVDPAPPMSSTEAEGVSSRVLALATTPSLVSEALTTAGVDDDPREVAENRVTAQRLGESSVVELTVREQNPKTAAAIVSALASRVTTFMNEGDRQRFTQALTELDRQITAAAALRTRLAVRLDNAPVAKQDRLNSELTTVETTLDNLYQQRATLSVSDATRTRAVVVDADQPDVAKVASTLVPRTALALVLGLVVGLMLAAAVETLRPAVPNARSLSHLLDVPLLGSTAAGERHLHAVVSRAARRHGCDTVILLGAGHQTDAVVPRLVHRLRAYTRVDLERYASDSPDAMVAQNGSSARKAAAQWGVDERRDVGLEPRHVRSNGDRRSTATRRLHPAGPGVARGVGAVHLAVGAAGIRRALGRRRSGVAATSGPRVAGHRPGHHHGRPLAAAGDRGVPPRGALAAAKVPPAYGAAEGADAMTERPELAVQSEPADHRSFADVVTAGRLVRLRGFPDPIRRGLLRSAGDRGASGERHGSTPDVTVTFQGDRRPFDVSGWEPVTRGAWSDSGSAVVIRDLGRSGFDHHIRCAGQQVDIAVRWTPSLFERAAAGCCGLASRP